MIAQLGERSRVIAILAAHACAVAVAPSRVGVRLRVVPDRVSGRHDVMATFPKRGKLDSPKNLANRAEPLLRKAIELDPGYAQAIAWLAMAHWVKYFNDHKPSDINESLRVAKSAVAIDPDDSLCHAQYGYACLFSRQFELADYHTGRAVELNPADMLSLSLRAHFHCRTGKSERTLEILDEVLRHDPFPPSWYWENRSIALLTLERYAEVIEAIRRMQEIFWWDHAYLAVSYLHLGKLKEMKDSVAAAFKKRPDLNIEQMMKGEPYADTRDSERLIKGLRAVGFL